MAARLGNVGVCVLRWSCVGVIISEFVGALNFGRGARGARQNSGRGGFGIEAQYWAFARQHVYVAIDVRAKGGYVARRVR